MHRCRVCSKRACRWSAQVLLLHTRVDQVHAGPPHTLQLCTLQRAPVRQEDDLLHLPSRNICRDSHTSKTHDGPHVVRLAASAQHESISAMLMLTRQGNTKTKSSIRRNPFYRCWGKERKGMSGGGLHSVGSVDGRGVREAG